MGLGIPCARVGVGIDDFQVSIFSENTISSSVLWLYDLFAQNIWSLKSKK